MGEAEAGRMAEHKGRVLVISGAQQGEARGGDYRSLLPPSGLTLKAPKTAPQASSWHLGLKGQKWDTIKVGDKGRTTSASCCVHILPWLPRADPRPQRHPPYAAPSASRVCPHPSSKHLPAPSVSWHQLPPWLQPSVLGQLPTCCSRPGTSWAFLSRQGGHC